MEADYLSIMKESLEKKIVILNQIIELNRQQKFLLQDANLSPEDFESNLKYKAGLVDQLNLMDEGFEELFQRVKEALNTNRAQYAEEIRQMQELIREITEKTNKIQVQEIQNKENAEQKFRMVRTQVKEVRNSQKVVKQYYDNMRMHKSGGILDNKK